MLSVQCRSLVLAIFMTITCLLAISSCMSASADDQVSSDVSLDDSGDVEGIGQVEQSLTNTKVTQYCYGGGGKWVASCEAYCPAGYLATGGGCQTSNDNWKVISTRPTSSGEGWHCKGGEDWGSNYYYYSVTGYVVCIQM